MERDNGENKNEVGREKRLGQQPSGASPSWSQPTNDKEFKTTEESSVMESSDEPKIQKNRDRKSEYFTACSEFQTRENRSEEAICQSSWAVEKSSHGLVRKPVSDTDPDEGPSCSFTNLTAFSLATSTALHCMDRFHSMYEEELQQGKVKNLGKGGFGLVIAGHRRPDLLPVAIKKTKKQKLLTKVINNHIVTLPREVAVLIHLGAGPEASGHDVTPVLLDWFDLDDQLIMIFERPIPSMNLLKYLKHNEGSGLHIQNIKIIMTQLLNKAIKMQSKNVFHHDIKLENILIEFGQGIEARFIDFGCSDICPLQELHSGFRGTGVYMPPEWVMDRYCAAGPTTVWQLGTVLYAVIHGQLPFENDTELVEKELKLHQTLSHDCKDFLKKCLTKNPRERPTLEMMRLHPWLN